MKKKWIIAFFELLILSSLSLATEPPPKSAVQRAADAATSATQASSKLEVIPLISARAHENAQAAVDEIAEKLERHKTAAGDKKTLQSLEAKLKDSRKKLDEVERKQKSLEKLIASCRAHAKKAHAHAVACAEASTAKSNGLASRAESECVATLKEKARIDELINLLKKNWLLVTPPVTAPLLKKSDS